MRPIKVEFQAFGPYAGYEVVDFEAVSEKGLFLICGKTGIGKTMILDAMTFALYGKSSGHSRDDFAAMRCTNAEFEKTTFVKFEFENNGEHFIFERRLERKRKNLSASYNLMKKGKDGIWRTLLENPKEKALNDKAVEIIGLEYEQFSQVIVLPQGKFEKLLTSNSDEKEKILTSIFGEDKWQEIAERLYDEAERRKSALKEIKDKISNSLREEQCESISQLAIVIAQKEKQIEEMDCEYKNSDYEKKKKELQDLLAVAKRFGDLHKAENKVKELAGKKEENESRENAIVNAVRANKVKDLLEVENSAKKEFEERQRAEKNIRETADKRKDEARIAAEKLKLHEKKSPEIEDKKKIKISYEGKRPEYEGLDKANKILNDAVMAEKNARTAETKAKEALDAFGPLITELQKAYGILNDEHKDLLERYLAGITGEIASQLSEGKPCPVCGSTSHPRKAVKADNSVTKAMVDGKKRSAEEKYSVLQDTLTAQASAKTAYEEKHTLSENSHSEVVAARTRLDGVKKNLAEGIATSKELEHAIRNLDKEITAFDSGREALASDEKRAGEAYTEAKAKTDPAEKETKAAAARLEKASKDAEKSLRDNDFTSADDARKLMMSPDEIEDLRTRTADYKAAVKTADETLKTLKNELEGMNEPDEYECNEKLKAISDAQASYAENRGILDSEIKRLKKKRENLEAEGEGIEEKLHEAEADSAFAKRLRGDSGTGLQRYVLGIMFSSVVAAANKMLEMVHGGRYRLYRSDDKAQGSNKRGLELKVFDKNSEEHEGRFVSTLSGGEKFLASLALSIGMSTVALKSGIRIEALFIDEGFGSLDEDSIADAMNVLDSIQKAHGLVGIISHVQLLQERIPVKLKVEQHDGGSHIVQSIG